MSNNQFPDYYNILSISQQATQDQIRQAYKKESLKTHPDRLVNATPAETRRATERFQAVADAYYVLSDSKRRKEYDLLYQTRSDRSADPNTSSGFFSGMFGGSSSKGTATGTAQPNAEGVFADVFDDLLRPEVERRTPFWSWFGAICGAGIGFIIANFPGLMLGAVAGNRLGAVRDAKGKSVAAVFNDLGGQQKAEILRALAMKVLGSAL
ncbi:DnaJ domain-containing protein [Crepidotus variabilis]|uniref:DnaJ domain-containing protein n=1 Tax=Crepidotus variabilis TaxID=179855 RepID=A0A9P6JT84_9AGAR|nr:DnaJ domain-containing protein [Crepidotus variabilis]